MEREAILTAKKGDSSTRQSRVFDLPLTTLLGLLQKLVKLGNDGAGSCSLLVL